MKKVSSVHNTMCVSLRSMFNRHHWAFSLRIWENSIFSFSFGVLASWVRIGKHGLFVTTKPRFSVREGYKKALKVGKFYFELL